MALKQLKKVAHVTFDMRIGGAEQVILNLVKNTDHSLYDISILCLDRPIGPFGISLQNNGTKVVSFARRPGFDIELIRTLRRYVLSHCIDILHCHQYSPYVYGVLAAMGTKCRVIFTEHGRFHPDQRKLKRILINPLLSRITDHITAISMATKNALVRYENFPPGKIRVIYNGIDDTRYRLLPDPNFKESLGLPASGFILGTVARLDSIKNQALMIRGLRTVLQTCPDTYLLLVGDGPERERLEKLAADLQLSSHILFTGFRQDTHHFYKIMDIFLLTSFSEGTAMTLLEAMASSLPCIATGVGGNPEIVQDRETGVIIANDNEDALAQSILALHENKDQLRNLGLAGRRRFEEHFTVRKMVGEYQKIYDGNG